MTTRTLAAERRSRLIEAMGRENLDLLLLVGNAWQIDYLRYATDFGILEGQGAALVERAGRITLFLDHPLEAERAELECEGMCIVPAPDLPHRLHEALGRFGDSRMGLAPYRLVPHGIAAGTPFIDATALLDRLLMDKLEAEIARVRRASRLADEGYAVFRAAARAGRPDYELVAEVEAFFRAKGAEDNFQIIGVGGPEVRGMAPPSGRRLREGDLVTTELTPCVDGYHAQICRTLVVGAPSAEQTAAFAVFREALEAGLAAVRPGATAADIARAENDVFRRHGLGEYVSSEYTRVRGHGLGLFPDSKPPILENVTTRIDAGMTLIVHPNTYHPAVGYIVLGDSVVVDNEGCEVLTATPRALFTTAP